MLLNVSHSRWTTGARTQAGPGVVKQQVLITASALSIHTVALSHLSQCAKSPIACYCAMQQVEFCELKRLRESNFRPFLFARYLLYSTRGWLVGSRRIPVDRHHIVLGQA